MTYRGIRLDHRADRRKDECQKNGSMMESYRKGWNHKSYVCVKDHQKEGTEKVEHFCKEIPAKLIPWDYPQSSQRWLKTNFLKVLVTQTNLAHGKNHNSSTSLHRTVLLQPGWHQSWFIQRETSKYSGAQRTQKWIDLVHKITHQKRPKLGVRSSTVSMYLWVLHYITSTNHITKRRQVRSPSLPTSFQENQPTLVTNKAVLILFTLARKQC